MLQKITGVILGTALLTACGGSGDGGSLIVPDLENDASIQWEPGVYPAAEQFKDICANPRIGNDPFSNNESYPDIDGEFYHENFWLRSWINDWYLWYDDVPDLNPFDYRDPIDYFNRLKSSATTASGNLKDNFHFAVDTVEYNNSNIGLEFGYGLDIAMLANVPPRDVRVVDVYPGSPADLAGVQRGMRIVGLDNIDVVNSNVDADINAINAALQATEAGITHSFTFDGLSDVLLTTGSYTDTPVKNVSVLQTETGSVGYMFFKSHNDVSEPLLVEGFNQFADAGVTDLILDMRYNRGGLGVIASQVAYMIAGAANTANRDFLIQQFNDKYETTDPFSGEENIPLPFINITLGLTDELAEQGALPQLNLSRVYILSTPSTCSASELLINGLRGIGVDVVLIGDTTCGKPYGFVPEDNCGTTYMAIQIAAVNDLEFGDYSDGFTPANKTPLEGVEVPGCWVQDEFSSAFGSSQEALLAAALEFRASGTCPSVSVAQNKQQQEQRQKGAQGLSVQLREKPWRDYLILPRK